MTRAGAARPEVCAPLLGGLARCYCGAPAYGTRNSRGAPGYRCRQMAGTGRDPAPEGMCAASLVWWTTM